MTIENGVAVTSDNGYLGYNSGSTGTATVDGAGVGLDQPLLRRRELRQRDAENHQRRHGCQQHRRQCRLQFRLFGSSHRRWRRLDVERRQPYRRRRGNGLLAVTNGGAVTAGDLYIGNAGGNGTLKIANNGAVSVAGDTAVGETNYGPAAGTISFGPNGGTLTTETIYASPAQVTGNGTINAAGLVSDGALVFNSAGSLKQTVHWNSLPGQDVTINLDMSTPASNGDLGRDG